MAHPIGVKSYLKTESVENGATNRKTGVFKFYKLLKLTLIFPFSAEAGALSLSLKCNKILKSLK
jgi:hypothetical protein